MNFFQRITMATRAGFTAFRTSYVTGDSAGGDDFGIYEARSLRYELYWAFFENTAYSTAFDTEHVWAKKLRADFGLYEFTRNIYNPAYRLGTFMQTHIMGGTLDPAAGDGTAVPSALPIIVPESNASKEDALRGSLAELWKWSNWQTAKDVYTLWGATLGDVFIEIVDDVARGRVYLRNLNPASVTSLIVDPFGQIKGYTIQEERADPETGRAVQYKEVVARGEDEQVIFKTFKDDSPFGWPDANGEPLPHTWEQEYGFIPLVHVKHNDVGLDWGWAELHPARPKVQEVDDQASKLNDQVRKIVDVPWYASGLKQPATTPAISRTAATAAAPMKAKEDQPIIYGPEGSSITPMVADLNIEAVSENIQRLLEEIERDYPELRFDRMRSSGTDVSGEALRRAREPANVKVIARRANYDHALVRAQQMALAIGGFRGYEAYKGFDLDSFKKGELDHTIGPRPVFAVDRRDQLAEDILFWQAAGAAAATDPALLVIFLRDHGWTDEKMKELDVQRVAQLQKNAEDRIPDTEQ